jgi:hypothetical protein
MKQQNTKEQREVKENFTAYETEIKKQIAELKKAVKEFSNSKDTHNWSGIGSLNHVSNELKEITRFIQIRK